MTAVGTEDWDHFRSEVKTRNRYLFCPSIFESPDTTSEFISSEEFLRQFLFSLKRWNRILEVKKGTILWRAQLGGKCYQPTEDISIREDGSEVRIEGYGPSKPILKAHDRDRMTPFSNKAREGRVNPKGIPCLYTATDPQTAMTEMKPKIGSYLTLAKFATAKELKIVDLARASIKLRGADGPEDEEWDALVWERIDDAFSEPVTDSDDIADYAPTQVIAEAFRRAGYDGIHYKSKLVEFDSLQPLLGSPERAQDFRAATSKKWSKHRFIRPGLRRI